MKKIFFLIALFILIPVYSQTKNIFDDVGKAFAEGAYVQALERLDQIAAKQPDQLLVSYWRALCYLRLQKFDEAIVWFERSKKFNDHPAEMYYQYGQALFAANQLVSAIEQFKNSYKAKIETSLSLYYIGYSYHLLGKFDEAKKYYLNICSSSKKLDRNIVQASCFQKAELEIESDQKLSVNRVKFLIATSYTKAFEIDRSSQLATSIKTRVLELQKKYKLSDEFGVKKYKLSLSQSVGYDSNVSQISEDALNFASTDKESITTQTMIGGSYSFNVLRGMKSKAEIELTYDHYLERNEPTVYQNESLASNVTLSNNYKHYLFLKESYLSFDLGYLHNLRDYRQEKSLPYYGSSYLFSLSEKMSLLSFGPTTVSGRYKIFSGYEDSLNSNTISISVNQMISVTKEHLFLMTADWSRLNASLDSDSSMSYMFRVDYIAPNVIFNTTAQIGLSLIGTDTMAQYDSRGFEKSVKPSMKFIYPLASYFDCSLEYNFLINISKDKENYDYSKHVVVGQIDMNF